MSSLTRLVLSALDLDAQPGQGSAAAWQWARALAEDARRTRVPSFDPMAAAVWEEHGVLVSRASR